jgi:hypothetical protein
VQGEPALLDAFLARVQRQRGIALDREAVQVMLGATAGFTVVGSDTETFRALLASDIARWGGLIRRLGLKPES